MADAIVSVVVERIAAIIEEQISREVNLVRGVDQKVLDLSRELQRVRDVLEDAERKGCKEKSVRRWLKSLEDTSYEMDDVLDEWQTALLKFQIQQQQQSNAAAAVPPPKNKVCSFVSCLCFQKVAVRRDIARKIENVKAKLDLVLEEKNKYDFVPATTTTAGPSGEWRGQSTSVVDIAEIHGRDIDRDVVASKILTAPVDHHLVEIVSIVGVGGVGKTTLAQLVFNDSRVKDCFELAIWICVSDPFDVAKIVRGIIVGAGASSPNADSQLDMLLKRLTECISGKKFLLVMDDVWEEDSSKWEPLKTSLKSCGGIGSKVLMTTRKETVAKTMGSFEKGIHRLGVLSDEACWLLLQRIALFGKSEEDCAMYKGVGMEIAKKCKGLPLAAKTLGSLLSCKNGLVEWENVLRSEIWELKEAEVQLFPHLLLSYNELTPALKHCFSYCAVFPKDSRIEVEEVIGHWMALGYLGSDIGSGGGGGDMELRGRQYFHNLAMRSLFQDFEKDEAGEQIKYFQLHDIVHDFARFLRNNGTVVMEVGTNTKTSCQAYCSPELVSQAKEYRSLYWDGESPICMTCLRSLRVLRLRISGIPQKIDKFIHLRWLDFSFKGDLYIQDLETICNELYNLQTLLLQSCKLEEIPRGIGNLIRLRHLDLSCNNDLKESPESICGLRELQTLLLAHCNLEEIPRGIGNLIRLRQLNLCFNYNESLIKELPESICGLHELQTLLLDGCNLKEIPRGIGNLIRLRQLNLCYNESLRELPESICDLHELQTHFG